MEWQPTERELIEQLCADLNQAHDELMRLQKLDPKRFDWPEWTPQANTIRAAERMLGKKLAKTDSWTEFPTPATGGEGMNDNELHRQLNMGTQIPLFELRQAAADRIRDLESALKVIHTWASVDGALDPEHVRELCNKALGRK